MFDLRGNNLHDIGYPWCDDWYDDGIVDPSGLAIDTFGNLLVVDKYNCRLHVYTTDGYFLYTIKMEGQFERPRHIKAWSTDVYSSRMCMDYSTPDVKREDRYPGQYESPSEHRSVQRWSSLCSRY